MEENIAKFQGAIIAQGISVLAAAAIFIIGRWIVGMLTRAVEKMLIKTNVDATLANFLKNLLQAAGMTFVVLAVLSKLGIQTASFIAVLGAAGLAVGMALQGSLSNFASGVLIILFRPYKVGDFIEAAGVKGNVQEVQIFNTVLSTPDNIQVILPNAQALSSQISNYSANPTRRIDLVVGISYKDDISKAKKVLMDTLLAEPRVLKSPAPVVAVLALADNSVNMAVRPWVKSEEYWDVYFALTENIKKEIDRNGLNIPFPQRDVYVHGLPVLNEKKS